MEATVRHYQFAVIVKTELLSIEQVRVELFARGNFHNRCRRQLVVIFAFSSSFAAQKRQITRM